MRYWPVIAAWFAALTLGMFIGGKVEGGRVRLECGVSLATERGARIEAEALLDSVAQRVAASLERRTQTMLASWYGPGFHGRPMANRATFNQDALTVAHKTWPLGAFVWIENTDNGRAVYARVTDRGPYWGERALDVSRGVAEALGMVERGVVVVRARLIE